MHNYYNIISIQIFISSLCQYFPVFVINFVGLFSSGYSALYHFHLLVYFPVGTQHFITSICWSIFQWVLSTSSLPFVGLFSSRYSSLYLFLLSVSRYSSLYLFLYSVYFLVSIHHFINSICWSIFI